MPQSDSAIIDGVLVVHKPVGPTSHDVVVCARRSLGVSRIGHTGTLDPQASGVLPLVLGQATRLAQHLTRIGQGIRSDASGSASSPTPTTRPATIVERDRRRADG